MQDDKKLSSLQKRYKWSRKQTIFWEMTDKEVGRLHEVRIFSSKLFAVEVGREADWLIKSFIRERKREGERERDWGQSGDIVARHECQPGIIAVYLDSLNQVDLLVGEV